MTAGMVVGAGASYLLVQWSRGGGLVRLLPAADATVWLWVGALSLLALLLSTAWLRFGRGVCAIAPIGFIVAAGIAFDGGHDRFAPPLLAVAAACVIACGVAVAVEERIRRPA